MLTRLPTSSISRGISTAFGVHFRHPRAAVTSCNTHPLTIAIGGRPSLSVPAGSSLHTNSQQSKQNHHRSVHTTVQLPSSRHPLSAFPLLYDRYSLWPFRSSLFGGDGSGGLMRFPSDPFAILDSFFDDRFQFQIRENAARLTVAENGDLTYTVDVTGYRPEELKVHVEGSDVCVQGEHKERTDGEMVHRQFSRRVRLPDYVDKEAGVRCELDSAGQRLVVTAQRCKPELVEEPQKRQIPIETVSNASEGSDGGETKSSKQ